MPPEVSHAPSQHPATDHRQVLPLRGYVLGITLFLVTLAMLFGAAFVGYAIIRVRLADPGSIPDRLSVLPLGAMRPPMLLFVSTALILASSITVHHAADHLRRGHRAGFGRAWFVTLLLAMGFMAVQAPALWSLLRTHERMASAGTTWGYGFALFLILLHALHVLGGVVPMVVIHLRAASGRYDGEGAGPVVSLVYYWHFLGAVWVVMFSLFMVLG